jgi:hypothetical protein
MSVKAKDKGAATDPPKAEKSPEYLRFEEILNKVIKAPPLKRSKQSHD